ncbi:unnamed protein product [Didymodactylos carnosus]|uniref:Uncharacterized protein n=1 Tax=Didymodactylos carnosus TaxID=1234261 RepID=A0A8S2FQS0_9BILA|nr:unnamed protein product [Didymodactylos carnosus]CAF4327103.1 unnamed protein product [Didymodactylos carnosus]
MPTCAHPTAHPRHKRGAILSSVPVGKRKVTAEIALSINKYIRKRYKRKVSTLKENDLLRETCYAAEQRRWSNKKSIKEGSSDEESDPSFQATVSPLLLSIHK